MPVHWIEFFFNKAYKVTILKALLKPSDIFTLLQPTDGVVRKLSKISIAINLYQAHGAFHLVNLSTIKEFFFWELIIGSDHMGFRKSHLYLVANYCKQKHNFMQFECYISKYCKVASRSTSWLVAPQGFSDCLWGRNLMLMYKEVQNWIVAWSTACDFSVDETLSQNRKSYISCKLSIRS